MFLPMRIGSRLSGTGCPDPIACQPRLEALVVGKRIF